LVRVAVLGHVLAAQQHWKPAVEAVGSNLSYPVDDAGCQPWVDYPRPLLTRNAMSFMNLNGAWQFDYKSVADLSAPAFGYDLPDNITVPFPMESRLSGIHNTSASGFFFYRLVVDGRTLPARSPSRARLLLRFEASHYETHVWVNTKKQVVLGQGGSSKTAPFHVGDGQFSFDVTAAVEGPCAGTEPDSFCPPVFHEIMIGISDREPKRMAPGRPSTGAGAGKAYSPASGIYGTVWFEAVPKAFISDLAVSPAASAAAASSGRRITVQTSVQTGAGGTPAADFVIKVSVTAPNSTAVLATGSAPVGTPVTLDIPASATRWWSAADPLSIYQLTAVITDSDGLLEEDVVGSAFALHAPDAALRGASTPAPAPAPAPAQAASANGLPLYRVGAMDNGCFLGCFTTATLYPPAGSSVPPTCVA
jgi:hypothetical protein